MDRLQEYKVREPFISLNKSLRVAGFALVSLLLFHCQTLIKSAPLSQPPDYLLLEGAKQLTFEGENDSPTFSKHGDKVIFVSRKRASHRNSQVYEIQLLKNIERRITFQDGEILQPSFISDEKVLYASSTDEIKENFADIRQDFSSTNLRLPTEIYSSDLYGNDIQRLTKSPGYDDEPNFVGGQKPFIIFTSFRSGALGIFKYDFKSKITSPFISSDGHDSFSPTVSGDFKQLAWLERSKDNQQIKILLSPLKNLKPQIIKDSDGDLRDLHFVLNDSKLIYSSLKKGESLYQIEIFDFAKNCTQVVFRGRDSLIQPAYSPGSPSQVVFTRDMKASRQIYLVDLPPDLGPCLEAKP